MGERAAVVEGGAATQVAAREAAERAVVEKAAATAAAATGVAGKEVARVAAGRAAAVTVAAAMGRRNLVQCTGGGSSEACLCRRGDLRGSTARRRRSQLNLSQ